MVSFLLGWAQTYEIDLLITGATHISHMSP